MCQQTRIDTVLPYYEKFLHRWPTVGKLAAAPVDDVLHAWAGLGYYSRARNLHKAAQMVAADGGFPKTLEGLMKLPGVGRYTGGAIASMAFGADEALVDGNVERVLARHFGIEADLRSTAGKKLIWAKAEELLWQGRAGDWNQALMEWGALICHPKRPDCGNCPVNETCVALRDDQIQRLPVLSKKAKPQPVFAACGVLEKEGKIFLRKRPETGLLAGLWECPSTDFLPQRCSEKDLSRHFSQYVSSGDKIGSEHLGTVRHVFSHRKLTMEVYLLTGEFEQIGEAGVWLDPTEASPVALSKLTQKVLALRGKTD